jgi:hypothetical protein
MSAKIAKIAIIDSSPKRVPISPTYNTRTLEHESNH